MSKRFSARFDKKLGMDGAWDHKRKRWVKYGHKDDRALVNKIVANLNTQVERGTYREED